MNNYLAVALGGAIGSMGRYWLTVSLVRYPPHWLPVGTISVNVIGSFIIGVVWAYVAPARRPKEATPTAAPVPARFCH